MRSTRSGIKHTGSEHHSREEQLELKKQLLTELFLSEIHWSCRISQFLGSQIPVFTKMFLQLLQCLEPSTN